MYGRFISLVSAYSVVYQVIAVVIPTAPLLSYACVGSNKQPDSLERVDVAKATSEHPVE